jgi:hypothetical protein
MAKPLSERLGETRDQLCKKCMAERTFELRNLRKFPNKLKYFWACTVCGNKHYIDA